MKTTLLLAPLFLFCATAFAEEMETDRPDFTEGTVTIEPGRLQLETGYTFTYDDEDDIRRADHIFPEALVRIGAIENVELRLGWPGYEFEEVTDKAAGNTAHADGGNDMGVGFKHRVFRQNGSLPTFAYIANLNVPSGSEEFSADKVEPETKLLFAYDFTDELGLAGNTNFAAPYGDDGRYFEFSFSGSLAYSLTESVGSYFEYFGFYPEGGAGEEDTHYLNSGLTWGLTEDIQLDVRAGFGLNDESDDFFTGAGFSWRS